MVMVRQSLLDSSRLGSYMILLQVTPTCFSPLVPMQIHCVAQYRTFHSCWGFFASLFEHGLNSIPTAYFAYVELYLYLLYLVCWRGKCVLNAMAVYIGLFCEPFWNQSPFHMQIAYIISCKNLQPPVCICWEWTFQRRQTSSTSTYLCYDDKELEEATFKNICLGNCKFLWGKKAILIQAKPTWGIFIELHMCPWGIFKTEMDSLKK